VRRKKSIKFGVAKIDIQNREDNFLLFQQVGNLKKCFVERAIMMSFFSELSVRQ